ncbi:ECF transporter S component [Leuconostocaceae bacterium ESL0958]|nr:ECF transporter S component [Leuconostocaceae bacterium ESL0958]
MSTKKNQHFVLTTVFVAIVLLQSFIPLLGYLPLGAFVVGAYVVIVPTTAALAGALLGPRSGAIVGFFWGLASFARAFTLPGTFGGLLFSNPVTAILPRIAVGLLIGLLAQWLRSKRPVANSITYFTFGALAALLNTALVVLLTWLSFQLFPVSGYGIPAHHLLTWLIATLAFNAGFEIVANGLLVMILGRLLQPMVKSRG